MGREQTQKAAKYGAAKVTVPNELPPPQTPQQVQGFVDKFPLGNPRGKTTGFNVFGIGGTAEYPNPYKNEAQKKFAQFTQQAWSNIFGENVFTDLAKSVQIPAPASPTPTCTTCDSDKCKECNAWDIPCEAGHMFAGTCTPPEKPPDEECDLGCLLTARGCDCGCKDVKPCTTCNSAVCAECNAWDLQCEDCKKKDGTCTPPEPKPPCDMGCWLTGRGCECDDNDECGFFDIECKGGKWWDKYGLWVMLIGGIIGLGILLWLLRPLFGFAKNITGVSKSAVTRVNGLK